MQKPSFWRVLVAYFVDLCVLVLFDIVCFVEYISIHPGQVPYSIITPVFLILNIGYFALLEWKQHYSLGKRLVGLLVLSRRAQNIMFLKVFFAYAVDALFAFTFVYICFVVGIIAHDQVADYLGGRSEGGGMVFLFLMVALGGPLLTLIYYVLLETFLGASLGKQLMGLQVVQTTPVNKTK